MNVVVLVIAGAVAVATDASQYILFSLFCTAFCHYLNFLVVIMLCCVRFFQTGRAFALLCGSAQWFIRQILKILRKIINIGHVPNSKKRWVKIYRLTSKRWQKRIKRQPKRTKIHHKNNQGQVNALAHSVPIVKYLCIERMKKSWEVDSFEAFRQKNQHKQWIRIAYSSVRLPVRPLIFISKIIYRNIYRNNFFFEIKIRQSIK